MGQVQIASNNARRAPPADRRAVPFPSIILDEKIATNAGAAGLTLEFGKSLTFNRNQHIFHEGDAATELYFVERGSLLSYRVTPSGRRLIPAIYMPGDIIGLETPDEFSSSCVTLSKVTVQACRRTALLSLMRSDKATFEIVWHKMSVERADHEQYTRLLGAGAMARVCGFILRMARQAPLGNQAEMPISRREIADHLCLTVETVCRIFTKLRAERIIKYARPRSIQILNRAYLLEHLDT